MIELNTEVFKDISNALNLLVEFSKIDDTVKIPLSTLNYKALRKTCFRGDEMMTKYVSSSLICNLIEVVEECILTDGYLILGELEENCEQEIVYDLYCEYLDTLKKEHLELICNESDDYILNEDFICFLACKGFKSISIKVPFVTVINEYTISFVEHIPYLVQEKYNLSSCLYLSNRIKMNTDCNCVQIDILYLPDSFYDFVDDSKINDLYGDFMRLIKGEIGERSYVRSE